MTQPNRRHNHNSRRNREESESDPQLDPLFQNISPKPYTDLIRSIQLATGSTYFGDLFDEDNTEDQFTAQLKFVPSNPHSGDRRPTLSFESVFDPLNTAGNNGAPLSRDESHIDELFSLSIPEVAQGCLLFVRRRNLLESQRRRDRHRERAEREERRQRRARAQAQADRQRAQAQEREARERRRRLGNTIDLTAVPTVDLTADDSDVEIV